MKKYTFEIALLSLITTIITGCVSNNNSSSLSYYHVYCSPRLGNPEELKSQREITAAPDLFEKVGSYKRVVVSAPQFIAKRSSKGATVMKDDTSYWLSEIERHFLSKGYTVLSRQKFEELRLEESVRSDETAANLLGADLIIQINTLSFDEIDMRSRTFQQFSCFKSDSVSEQGIQLPIGSEFKLPQEIVSQALSSISMVSPNNITIIELNAKIIDAATGEIVYFYNDNYSIIKEVELCSVKIVLKNWKYGGLQSDKWEILSATREDVSRYSINDNFEADLPSGNNLIKIAASRFITSFIESQKSTKHP